MSYIISDRCLRFVTIEREMNTRDEGNLRIAFKKDTYVFDVLSYVS